MKWASGQVFGHRRKKPEVFLVGLYARVSTQDKPTIPLQMHVMPEYAATRDSTIVLQVKEVGSGAFERELWQNLIEALKQCGGVILMSYSCGVWTGGADR